MTKTIQVGKLPGRLQNIGITGEETFKEVFGYAELEVGNFEVKVDGVTVTNFEEKVPLTANSILLTAKVKGNSFVVQVGKLPGRLQNIGLNGTETFKEAFAIAEIEVGSFEVKADGITITNLDSQIPANTNSILLTAKVKGNEEARAIKNVNEFKHVSFEEAMISIVMG